MAVDAEEYVEYALVAIVAVLMMGVIASLTLSGSASITPATDSNVTIENRDDIPSGVTVSATRENAVSLPDTGGYVDTPAPDNGSRTVCASAQLAEDANQQAAYTIYGDGNGTFLLQYDAGNWLFYVENGTTGNSAAVRMAAPNPANGFQQVCGRYDVPNATITASRGATVSAPVALDSATETRNVSLDWYGRIDEVRTFGEAVPNATLTAYGDDPIQPLPAVNRTGRLLFDEGGGSTSTVYFAGSQAQLVNAGWGSGLSDVSLQPGTDYEIHGEPFSIKVLSGGYLAGAPVVFVDWSLLPMGSALVEVIGVILGLMALAYILDRSGVIEI